MSHYKHYVKFVIVSSCIAWQIACSTSIFQFTNILVQFDPPRVRELCLCKFVIFKYIKSSSLKMLVYVPGSIFMNKGY